MSEFHIIGLGNLCEFVIKNIDEKQTYGTFSACDKHDRKSMQEFVDYVNQLIKENEQLKIDATRLITHYNGLNSEYEWLKEENERLKHLIQEAYETERTALGKSVLKQILDNVEAIK